MKRLLRWLEYELHAIEYGLYTAMAYLSYNMGEADCGEAAENHANAVLGRIDRLSIQP